MQRRAAIPASLILAMVACFCAPASAQIATITNDDGRRLFVNAEPPATMHLASSKSRATIYMNGESSFTGNSFGNPRLATSIDRDGAEKLVREAADRHHVDRALIGGVMKTESNWIGGGVGGGGGGGLMQLIPTTAQR